MFIVQATVTLIANYDRNILMAKATGLTHAKITQEEMPGPNTTAFFVTASMTKKKVF
jgi:hypothetical protein